MTYNPNNRGVPPYARASAKLTPNNSGGTIPKGIPVRVTPTGFNLINVSDENEVHAVAGVLLSNTINGANGEVVSGGLVDNISISATIGDIMYIAKDGGLTNIKPSIGTNGFVSGDWVVRVGVIAKNIDNPLAKDLIVNIDIVGEL